MSNYNDVQYEIKYKDQSGTIYRRPELYTLWVGGICKAHPGLTFTDWIQQALESGYITIISIDCNH